MTLRIRSVGAALGVACAICLGRPAWAQTPGIPGMPPAAGNFLATMPAPIAAPTTDGIGKSSSTLTLSAVFSTGEKPVRSSLVWRVFEDSAAGATPSLLAKSNAASPTFQLAQGTYVVHVAYGFASASKRIVVGPGPMVERIAVKGGALRLAGAIGDVPIARDKLSFSILLPVANDTEGRLVAANVKPGEVVRLPEGTYHVVSNYGDSNAIMRVDLKVDAGQLTDATVNHRAATVTLKLIAGTGGEAFAGTAFSVLTPGGDVIREATGAFPTMTLAEGDYQLVARHAGSVYTRDFKVESGLDRDIDVLAN